MKLPVLNAAFAIIVFILGLFVIPQTILAYDSTDYKLGSFVFFTDTHSIITENAHLVGNINQTNYPDLIRFKKDILKGDSDEKEAHQGSDKLANNSNNQSGWFGDQTAHWKKLLEEYNASDFLKSYHRVGVLLHLTADASVPSHVRVCPHGDCSEEYFGTGSSAKTQAQSSFKNNLVPFPFNFIKTVHVDNYETIVDRLAYQNRIPLTLGMTPRLLPQVDQYMTVVRQALNNLLNSDSFYDQYWAKNTNWNSWGSYGSVGDTFGLKSLSNKDYSLIYYGFNVAVLYSSGQLQLISQKLPPLIEKVDLSPSQFGNQGTKISLTISENRTQAVKIKIIVEDNTGRVIIDEKGQGYDGKVPVKLDVNNSEKELPYKTSLDINWKADTLGGKIPVGKGKIKVEVIDEDGNSSQPAIIEFEYLPETEQTKDTPILDQSKKVGSPPVFDSFSYIQLHQNYEDVPHRYLLSVNASDPENGPLIYNWQINCGYFTGLINSSQVEWRYNTPGECIDAVVTVTVKDNDQLEAQKSQKVF